MDGDRAQQRSKHKIGQRQPRPAHATGTLTLKLFGSYAKRSEKLSSCAGRGTIFTLSRRTPRYRLSLSVTVSSLLGGQRVVCRTRDLSADGISLDSVARFDLGTRVSVALVDPDAGSVVEVIGEVARVTEGAQAALGLRLLEPSFEWKSMVSRLSQRVADAPTHAQKRRRVLVVGDDQRQRGAMALYVTSGWDVMFASDTESVRDALATAPLDAVIAELDTDPTADGPSSWMVIVELMSQCRRSQPQARRIVRGSNRGGDFDAQLVHRFVDRDAGLDALVDALTADIGAL